MTTGQSRTFLELFAGGGMARAGLGPGWRCALACDIDEAKAASYRANWGSDDLVVCDVRDLDIDRIEGRVDLAWASPPCQDVSTAGTRAGLEGGRSGAVWPALDLLRRLHGRGDGPRLVVVENVPGMAMSRKGEDLAALASALAAAGYRVGAVTLDARPFVPQSRPRLFVVAAASDIDVPDDMAMDGPDRRLHPAAVVAVADRLPAADRAHWTWWNVPSPPSLRTDIADVLGPDDAARWHAPAATEAILAMVIPSAMARLDDARRSGRVVGTLARRMRPVAGGGREQRAELRLDGIAGCVLTAAGGSSQQALVVADPDRVRTRALTARESARLMGIPDGYRLPRRRDEAMRLVGDGVVAPVVRHLAATLLEPLLDAAPVSAVAAVRPGIKGATRSTTLYLLPHELRRLRRLAVDLDVSLHDLALRGLDRVLAEHGQRPLERYR
jgi:DNA (cytosine-5)-methyltransferase 1